MITVVGSINIDLIATVQRLPSPGETVPGTSFAQAAGGKGANQALAAARAGGTVRMVGAVGNDAFADPALDLLREAGVDLSSVSLCREPTGTALILVDEQGENVIAVVPGANATTLPERVDSTVLAEGDVMLLQLEVPVETVAAALARAKEAGARSLLNTAPFREDALDLLDSVDILIANETEFDLCAAARNCSRPDRLEAMKAMAGALDATIVVTLGAAGALAVEGETVVRAASLPVQPVDTVGAGDAFCGYLAAGLDAGLPLDQALTRAAAAGSLACTKTGAQPSLPLAEEVTAAMQSDSEKAG